MANGSGVEMSDSGAGSDGSGLPVEGENDLLRQTELIISYVLRGGVLLAAGIITLGVLLFYIAYLHAGATSGPITFPHTASEVFLGLGRHDPVAVISLGLLVLLLTPVLRVLVSVVIFALEHDWRYTGITLLVFFILLVSFLLGRGGS